MGKSKSVKCPIGHYKVAYATKEKADKSNNIKGRPFKCNDHWHIYPERQ